MSRQLKRVLITTFVLGISYCVPTTWSDESDAEVRVGQYQAPPTPLPQGDAKDPPDIEQLFEGIFQMQDRIRQAKEAGRLDEANRLIEQGFQGLQERFRQAGMAEKVPLPQVATEGTTYQNGYSTPQPGQEFTPLRRDPEPHQPGLESHDLFVPRANDHPTDVHHALRTLRQAGYADLAEKVATEIKERQQPHAAHERQLRELQAQIERLNNELHKMNEQISLLRRELKSFHKPGPSGPPIY